MGRKSKIVNIIITALIIIGSTIWSSTMVKSGLVYEFGIGFWGPNGHDGIWHLALAESLKRLSLENPVFAGYLIKNYHIGFDIVLAALSKITFIPVSVLYFQIIPPVLALLIGLLTVKLVGFLTEEPLAKIGALFFIYFGGGFGFLVHIIRYGRLGGDSMFWAQSQATSLVNPPLALSLVLILAGLIILQKYLLHQKSVFFLGSVFFFSILIQIKAYAGIISLVSLGIVALWRLIKDKKWDLIWMEIIAGIASLVLFLPLNNTSVSILVFYPFWFLETMMAFGDRLNWEYFHSAMVNYKTGRIYLKLIPAYLTAFLVFLVGNAGTRIVAFFLGKPKKNFIPQSLYLRLFIISAIVFGISVPMFFVQKGTPWNTIQFFYYSLFFLGIIAGIGLVRLILALKQPLARLILIIIILVLTLPTSVTTMGHYLPPNPPAKISKTELAALNKLKTLPYGVVLSMQIPNRVYEDIPGPRALYRYDSTAYIAAYGQKPVFLDDVVNLDIMNYDWPARVKEIEVFLNDPNSSRGRTFLADNNVGYIYLIKGPRVIGLDEKLLGFKNVFDSEEVIIYQRK